MRKAVNPQILFSGVNTGTILTNAGKIGQATDTPATAVKDILLITLETSTVVLMSIITDVELVAIT